MAIDARPLPTTLYVPAAPVTELGALQPGYPRFRGRVGKDTRPWRSPPKKKKVEEEKKKKILFQKNKRAHKGEPADGDRRAAIADHAVRPRRASDGIGRATEVLVVGQRKGSAAVGAEQTGDGFGHSRYSAASGVPGEGNHQVAVQRSVGETARGNLLLHHGASEQRSRRRDRVTLHHKKFSGIHDVKNEIHGVGCSAEREGERHGAAAGGGIGNRVIRGGKGHGGIRAVAVDVARGVGERAGPVRSEPAFDGGTIVCVFKTGGAKGAV